MLNKIKQKILGGIFSNKAQTITSAAILIGAAALGSRLLGMVRQRLLVGTFGAGDKLDAYFAAFQVPDLAYNFLILATLSVAFIPVFCEYLNRDKKEAWHIANSILNLIIIVMGFLCFGLFLWAPHLVKLISPGFSGQKYELTVNLTRVLVLSPWLFSISTVFSSILNSFKSFTLVAIAPILYNLGIIFGILFLAPVWGIYGVVVGVIIGALLHIAIQIPGVKKFGFSWRPILDLKNRGVRQILKLILPRMLSLDVSQMSQLVGTIIASTLVVGSVAIFNLIYNIEAVPIGVFAISFVVSVFPSLSHHIARAEREEFRQDFSYTARQIIFFLVPLAILTFIFRAQIVRLIIGTQNLSWDETRLAAAALGIFAFAFVFQGISPLLARSFFALKNSLIPFFASIISIGVNVFSTFLFLNLLKRDGAFVSGIISFLKLEGLSDIRVLALPLGFFLASFFNTAVLFVLLRRFFGRLDGKKIMVTFLKYLMAGLVAGVVGYAGLYFIEPFLNTHTFIGVLLQLVFATLIALCAFVLVSLFLKSEEMINLARALRRKVFKTEEYVGVGETEEL
ncbi:MAG: murein biosynthesis integral membrane protein MurJ [Parcubacteria group bacterium CG1_02_40_82]|uniref:Probable lipid II flippase MurJ n=3 Tax=Candidatus Portnoyibacteriota TaxID=1817913 RepID=A0A2H0KVM0_9BACT|nr:MAG: murein biosynthesis integral membrane protein MurJ [Parcubacteria group bacterium CG1_02_40_82]PIQ75345.1 MAG: murein biosynthesis integral membrane protein MurJ [Candidatus Portnoybacteria bacterium CG11_big_fil_rev_8_21_14_0_20_40_15]PIS31333.1 MAG: murein biosynthesis integral membrane protein MurJ [Candidatus Portnoybacteria bacterium CG08_land_8_20_14_0_20_40_83]PIY74710.1 MAG: murein biosynthesis integral membrane protein MurJ [Candidatus Portnoybacteria bacterium CG_4_10_14_0_8_um